MGPADSIKRLTKTLARLPIHYDLRHVRDDVSALRTAFAKDDAGFAGALDATTAMLTVIVRDPTLGKDLQHRLTGWRRIKFPSPPGGHSDLRVIFRATGSGGIELRAFGRRDDPFSIYARARRDRD